MYVDKYEIAKDKSSTLLENYYKLLEVKNLCKDFEHCSKTTVDNICHIYYGLKKILICFCQTTFIKPHLMMSIIV